MYQKFDAVFTGPCPWSRWERNGSLAPLVFSLPAELGWESSRSSSSVLALLFLPQILHATTAKPPSKIAPPTPPTTPPMILLEFEESPELAAPPLPWMPGVEEEDADAAATIARDVLTLVNVLLPLTETIVVNTCWVMLPVFLAAGLDVIDDTLSVPEVRGLLEPWRTVAVEGLDDSVT